MGCPAISLTPPLSLAPFGSDSWNAAAHHAVSAAYRLSGAVRAQAAVFTIGRQLWGLDSTLNDFLKDFYVQVESGRPPAEPPNVEKVKAGIAALRDLHATINATVVVLQAKGFANRRFVSPALNSVKVRADEILDIVESVELSLTPEIDRIFDKSLREFKRGETFDLESVL